MSQTLINGTAYTINHGNTLVGGTAYTIDHGKTLVGGTSYDIELAGAASVPYSLSDWPGWSSATWEDVNNLCYAKQQGYIDSWPSDVTLGKTKQINVSAVNYATNAPSKISVVLIDRDKDGLGTLTFMMDLGNNHNNMGQDRKIQVSRNTAGNMVSQTSYILTVRKGYTTANNSTVTYQDTVFFNFSAGEMNLSAGPVPLSQWTSTNSEATYGVTTPYDYFNTGDSTTDSNHRKSTHEYWLRTELGGYYSCPYINTAGTQNSTTSNQYKGEVWGFVVGNPDAQTIE